MKRRLFQAYLHLKSHGRSETLEVVYEDKPIGLEVSQYITIYEDLGVLSFSASF